MRVLILPWISKTFKGLVTWRVESLFPPLIKAGKLGLLWSPTNFPGCCPIRAGCQAAAGTLQAGLSCSPERERIGRRQEPPFLAQTVLSLCVVGASHPHRSVLLLYAPVYHALMESKCFRWQNKAFVRNLVGKKKFWKKKRKHQWGHSCDFDYLK